MASSPPVKARRQLTPYSGPTLGRGLGAPGTAIDQRLCRATAARTTSPAIRAARGRFQAAPPRKTTARSRTSQKALRAKATGAAVKASRRAAVPSARSRSALAARSGRPLREAFVMAVSAGSVEQQLGEI